MWESSGIKDNVIDEIKCLAQKHQLSKVVLFGSRARGDYKSCSDIDLAVEGGDVAGFSLDVEEETSTLLFFDVVSLDGPVQKELLKSIKNEGKVLYEKI